MNEKEIAALLEKVQGTITNSEVIASLKADLANLKEGAITAETFKEKMDAFSSETGIGDLKESIEKIAIDLKKMQDAGPKKEVTLRDRLVEKYDTLKEISNGAKKSIMLDNVKTNVTRSSVTSHTLAYRLPDVGQEAFRSTVIASLFRQGTIGPNSGGTIRYVDQSTVTRNAATRAEAAAFPESAIAWTEYNLPIEKLTDSIPVTHESLKDIDFVESEIRRLLEVNMRILEDTQVYSGSGVTPNIDGAYTQATAFAATTPDVEDASVYDLLHLIKTNIGNGKESKYMANTVIMNPTDIFAMLSKKDANYNYVMPPFVSADGMNVAGMRIVPSAAVTANTLLVGDFQYGTYYTSEGYEVELGWVASQFLADLMTMKARKRAALLIRTIDNDAFLKVTDIGAAVTAITA